MIAREFFQGIGGAHGHAGIFVPKAFEQLSRLPRVRPDEIDNLSGSAAGETVAARGEHGTDGFRSGHGLA
jgi:hypothetical protein